MDTGFGGLEKEKEKGLRQLEAEHQHRLSVLQEWLRKQREIIDHISTEIDSARIAYNERIAEYDKKIETLKARPERPTREEKIEMDIIGLWKTGQARYSKKRKRS